MENTRGRGVTAAFLLTVRRLTARGRQSMCKRCMLAAGVWLCVVIPLTCLGGGARPAAAPEKAASGTAQDVRSNAAAQAAADRADRDAGTQPEPRVQTLADAADTVRNGAAADPAPDGVPGRKNAAAARSSTATAPDGVPDRRAESEDRAGSSNPPGFSIRRSVSADGATAPQARAAARNNASGSIKVIGGAQKEGVRLFNTVAFRGPLKALPKWERVLRENRRNPVLQKQTVSGPDAPAGGRGEGWKSLAARAAGAPPMEKLRMVNAFFNRWPYRLDVEIYGVSDFWATPAEFMRHSGDCEDYAISKYFALRMLGFPADALRIVVLLDSIRGIGHAVLVVFLDAKAYVLDNLSDLVLTHDRYSHYRPQYSVNEEYRWAHIPVRPAATGKAEGKQ